MNTSFIITEIKMRAIFKLKEFENIQIKLDEEQNQNSTKNLCSL